MINSIEINFIFSITSIVFVLGLFGVVLNRKNVLMIIMSIEILLIAVNLNFAAVSIYLDDVMGHIFVLFILSMAAAESAVGLSIITSTYELKGNIDFSTIKINKKRLNNS